MPSSESADARVDPPEHAPADHSRTVAALLTHDRLIGRRLHLHALARFAVAGLIVTGAWFAPAIVRIEQLDGRGLTLLALAIAFYNLLPWLASRPCRHRAEPSTIPVVRLRTLLRVTIVLDFLALSVAIWLVGGSRSPFLSFYLFHVIIASLLLSRANAFGAMLLACCLLYGLVLGEYFEILTPHIPIGATAGIDAGATKSPAPLDGRYVATVLVVYTTLFALTTTIVTSLVDVLRQSEQRQLEAHQSLERLSSLRRDFLHLTLHNIQSPLAASTMLLRNVEAGLAGPIDNRALAQIERSLARMDDLHGFLRNLRTLAQLESDDLTNAMKPVNLAGLLHNVRVSHLDLAEARGHEIAIELAPEVTEVTAVPPLIREALANFVSNAIKYTPPGGRITLRTRFRAPDRVALEVSDTGIGISEADQRRLFGEFVRLDHRHPDLGHVEGSGLGLSIVRRIGDMHHGEVGVTSRPGEGSTFFLVLPCAAPPGGRASDLA